MIIFSQFALTFSPTRPALDDSLRVVKIQHHLKFMLVYLHHFCHQCQVLRQFYDPSKVQAFG
jgi:hypothetical protein